MNDPSVTAAATKAGSFEAETAPADAPASERPRGRAAAGAVEPLGFGAKLWVATAVATLLGLLDGVGSLLAGAPRSAMGVLWSAGLAVPVGLLCGLGWWATAAALAREPRLWRRVDPAALDEAPVVRAARRLSWWLHALGMLAVVAVATITSRSIQVPAFALAWVVFLAGTFLILWRFSGPLVAAALAVVLDWLGRRLKPRWRGSYALRTLLFSTLPLSLALLGFMVAYRDELGTLCLIPYSVVLGAVLLFLARLERGRRWVVRAARPLAILGAVALVVAGPMMSRDADAAALVQRTVGPSAAVEPLRAALDFDGDGESAWFGGRDCAPLDPSRADFKTDIPDNGVDEDCDGKDASAGGLSARPPVSGLAGDLERRKYNVLFIVVDALRADVVFPSKYRREITREIDRFAKGGWTFENAYSQSSTTRISFPSFLSGRFPGSLRWEKAGRRYQIGKGQPMLQAVFRKAGYRTGFVTNKWFKEHVFRVLRGFDVVDNVWFDSNYRKWRNGSAPVTTSRSIELIDDAVEADAPFFLAVYYEGPHMPYHDLTDRGTPDFGNKSRDRYDEEVYYADQHIGFLLSYLRSKPDVYDDTIVVVTADHGEEFREHGNTSHSKTCYVESTHVPLIVRVPGAKPVRVTERVGLVDIAPTLLELTGLSSHDMTLDGESLLYPVRGQPNPKRALHCMIFNDSAPKRTMEQMVRQGDLALLREARSGRFSLFDTKKDPREKRNVAGKGNHAKDVERLRRLLSQQSGSFSK